MKIKVALILGIFIPVILFGGIKESTQKQAFSSLDIGQEKYLSDYSGVLNPSTIIGLTPSNTIRIYLVDGTVLTGIVKETTMIENEVFKVFGEMTNKDNCGFGFVLAKQGVFAGAVVFRDTQETYTVDYSEQAKGFVLIKSLGKKLKPI